MLRPGSHVKRCLNPDMGLPAFDFTRLWIGQQDDPRLTVYSPADDPTAERLDERLRIVSAGRKAVAA